MSVCECSDAAAKGSREKFPLDYYLQFRKVWFNMIHYNPSTILYGKSKTHLVDLQEYSILHFLCKSVLQNLCKVASYQSISIGKIVIEIFFGERSEEKTDDNG